MANSFFDTGEADARLLQELGITRVGDITELDNIGIPVWFASRPNSRALSVSQGKGATAAQARISAVMEAAEGAIAERPEDIVRCVGTLAEMTAKGRKVVPLERLMRCHADRIRPDRRLAWAQGFVQRDQTEIFAPYELVGMDMRTAGPWDRTTFKMSSVGLAAGGERTRVVTHALLEALEHDATSTLDLLGLSAGSAKPVGVAPGCDDDLDALIARVRAAGFDPHFYHLQARVEVPVVGCFFDRLVASADGANTTLTAGFACRPDVYDAARAALLECVQSRATDIAGSREDITAAEYAGSRVRLPVDPPGQRHDLASIPSHRPRDSFRTSQDVLDHLTASLGKAGIDDVYVFPLARRELGIEVVRVLVPELGVADDGGMTQGGAGLIEALLQAIT